MSLYLGTSPIAISSPSRNIGEIIQSTIPLTDAGLHLLDGSLISGSGSYSAFVTYISGLVSGYPDLFTTEANWQSSVSTYGVCGKFVYDSVNNTVRLPKITGFTEGTTDVTALGDLVEAGLPNIMGETGGGIRNYGSIQTGALYGTNQISKASVDGNYNAFDHLNFDASRSSSIYGNSSTVQPQAIKVLYYIVIASSITNELNLDVADMATKSLDNLDNTGKNIANWSNNVTNCITEIPQDIKLELNNGTLTLKAGSKVYVPNGAGVFDVVTIASDLSATYSDSYDIKCFLFYVNGEITLSNISVSSSGTTPPTTGFFYNTSTNKISFYLNGSINWDNGSFPLCIASCSNSTVTSIDQVFNGFGYIGSTVFALPGVKGLVPNGRNADGSLKNIEFELDGVKTMTNLGSSDFRNCVIYSNLSIGHPMGVTYDSVNNITHESEHDIYGFCIFGGATFSSGKITSFNPKTAFHALDYNDSSTISGWSMPSNKYIDLTLGASGSTYTAPANGYFTWQVTTTAANQFFGMLNESSGYIQNIQWVPINGGGCHGFIPAKSGDICYVIYTASNVATFRFIYAEGENV